MSVISDLVKYFCACCRKVNYLLYMKYDPIYHTAQCCMGLVCKSCYDQHKHGRKFKCSLCASQTIGVWKSKNGFKLASSWQGIFNDYFYYYSFVGVRFRFLIPYTQTREFGTWDDVGDVLSNRFTPSLYHPKFHEFEKRYLKFVKNFYKNMFLFHTLRSAPIRSLEFVRVEASPNMLEFFKYMPDMALFSDHSRNEVLRWGLNGFNYFVLDKLSLNTSIRVSQGERTMMHVKKKFLFMLLRIVLAKNPKLY